jgi:CheY-like chemotaxis protein
VSFTSPLTDRMPFMGGLTAAKGIRSLEQTSLGQTGTHRIPSRISMIAVSASLVPSDLVKLLEHFDD